MTYHFVYVPWTGLGLYDGYRGDAWLKKRIRIFNSFVLPSILNQSNKNFCVWFSFRPEEESNLIVQSFIESLESIRGFRLVVTYSGCCFWDDKYPAEEASKRLLSALEGALPLLKQSTPEETDHVLMTIWPSDDMYLSNAVDDFQNALKGERKIAGYTRGYIMNYSTKEIAEYNPTTSPPFFTIKFPADIFFSPKQHYNYTGPYESHEYAKSHIGGSVDVLNRGFVVGTHGANISTTYNHPYQGPVLNKEKTDSVLIRTGTLYSEPIQQLQGPGLLARRVLNSLPFQKQLRDLYYKQPIRI